MQYRHVADDWLNAVVFGLERCLDKHTTYEFSKESIVLFKKACARKGLFDVEDDEFTGRLRQLRVKASSKLTDGDCDSKRISIEILQCYVTYGEVSEFASWFDDTCAGCLVCLKETKDEQDFLMGRRACWELLERAILRLHTMSDVKSIKRDASAIASKAGALGKQMFDAESPCPALLGCIGACLIGFPASLKHTEKFFEAQCSSMLMKSGSCQRIAAVVFAMLPRISGMEDVWSRYSQRLLVSIHKILNELTDGLGDVKVESLHLASGVAPLEAPEFSGDSQMMIFTEYIGSLRGLMDSLTSLVSRNFPIPVPMPILGLISLCKRIMGIDMTRIRNVERAGRTTGQVAILGVHMASVQVYALRMLRMVMRICRGVIIPHMFSINRILASSAETICRLKSHGSDISDIGVLRQLLQCMNESIQVDGIAGTSAFSEIIITLAHLDISMSPKNDGEETTILAPSKKMSKTYVVRHQYGGRMESNTIKYYADVFETIENIFTFGSSVLQHEVRLSMEDFVLHMATSAHQLAERTSLQTKSDVSRIFIILRASLKALVAAVSCPCVYRPAHAAEALMLFRKTALFPSADVRSVSFMGISSLEISMHPKSLMLAAKVDNPEMHARNKHGMPSFWSFLEYDGTKHFVPTIEKAKNIDAEARDVTEPLPTLPEKEEVDDAQQEPQEEPTVAAKRKSNDSIASFSKKLAMAKKSADVDVVFNVPEMKSMTANEKPLDTPQEIPPPQMPCNVLGNRSNNDSDSDLPEIDSGDDE